MTLSQQIQEAQKLINAAKDALMEVVKSFEDDPSDANQQALTQKTTDVEALTNRLDSLKKAEKVLGDNAIQSPGIITRGSSKETDNLLGQMAAATWIAAVKKLPIDLVIECEFNKSQPLIEFNKSMQMKAVQNPAMSNVTGYAAELTQLAYGQMVDMLRAESILLKTVPLSKQHQFDDFNSIILPMRLGTDTQAAGSFRAEGDPIKVSGLTFGSLTLTPKNVAILLTATHEMVKRSKTVDLVAYFQSQIIADTSTVLDLAFVSNTVGTAIQPAGLRAGLTAGETRPSSGTTTANIVTDLKVMLQALSTKNMGGQNTAWVMHSKNWLAIQMALNAVGALAFPEAANGMLVGKKVVVSNSMPTDIVLLVDFEWVSMGLGVPQFDVSSQAVIHEETVPLPISAVGTPNVVAAPVRSLFQTNSMALRALMDADWAKLKPSVEELSAVAWA